ncbi:SIS domain-containing protein [Nitrosopumilus adriaticus]|uniref:SIS domain-containing protein n=1 Tax=Nitrosopumilus adriaticus TaxID=1580092 RepID=UPI00352E2AF3
MLKKDLEKIDSKLMFQTYDKWPEIAQDAYNAESELLQHNNIKEIIFVGMGGSGAINECFGSILSKTNFHVSIVKGYHLPKTISSDTLIVFTSVSGNTIETLSVMELACKTDCKIIGFSSGGKMEEFCAENNLEFRKIPMYNSPRASFVSYFYSMMKILEKYLPIKKEDILESIKLLKKIRDIISSDNLNEKNISLKLAQWINGIPMIYYPWGLQTAAIRFKNSLQENSKLHAMAEDILEASHNGIVSWEKSSNIIPILLEGEDDFIKTKERWHVIKNYFENNNIDYFEIFSEKGSIVSKLICLIYLLDYSSIYKAVLSEIDPTPVKSIEYIKKQIT